MYLCTVKPLNAGWQPGRNSYRQRGQKEASEIHSRERTEAPVSNRVGTVDNTPEFAALRDLTARSFCRASSLYII